MSSASSPLWPTSARGMRRREAILEALTTLLAERDLATLQVDDVADAVGINRSSFYFYFANLGDAVASLMDEASTTLIEAGSDWYERDDLSPGERVQRGMEATVSAWRSHARMLAAILEASTASEAASTLWGGVQERLEARATQRILDDQAAGLAPAHVNARRLAEVLVSMTAAMMGRDIDSIVTGGGPLHGVTEILTHVWTKSLYQ